MNNLQKAASRCLASLGKFHLDMESYIHESKSGTSFCLLGYLAKEDGYPLLEGWPTSYSKHTYPYIMYSDDVLGVIFGTDDWEWLFSERWSSDLAHAEYRCKFVIENGHVPTDPSVWEV